MKLRALVVDDEEFARKNLVMLLEEYCPEIEVIGERSKRPMIIPRIPKPTTEIETFT